MMIKHVLTGNADGSDEAEALRIPTISEERAREMHALAYAVRELEPWKEVADREGFGIRHPETGRVMTVALLGQAEAVFAVQLYLPEEGIRFWNRFYVSGEVDPHRTIYNLRMLECEFCDEEELPDEDVESNEAYPPPGRRHRRHGYPRFRSMRPRYYPWFLDDEESRLMSMALRLVPAFLEHLGTDRHRYFGVEGRDLMPKIPVFEWNEGGDVSNPEDWHIRRESYPLAAPERVPDPPQDDLFHARMARYKVKPSAIWETGMSFMPPTVVEGSLVYPSLFLTIDEEKKLTNPILGSPADNDMTLMRQSIQFAAENAGHLPAKLLVSEDWAAKALEDLAKQNGIAILSVRELPQLSQLMQGFHAMLDPEGPGSRLKELAEVMNESREDDEKEEGARGGAMPEYRPPRSAERYVMRVDLMGAKPPIWRRITLPVDASFFDLHLAIQAAMGWEGSHLHGFEIRQDGRWPIGWIELKLPDDDPACSVGSLPRYCEVTTRLNDVVEQGHETFIYSYDFGDDWNHKIKIEKIIRSTSDSRKPTLIKGRGACPPENCGGVPSYLALLEGHGDKGMGEAQAEKARKAVIRPEDVLFPDAEGVLREIYRAYA